MAGATAAQAKLDAALTKVAAIREKPPHARGELESEAFDALRSALVTATHEPQILDGCKEVDMLDCLSLITKRGTEKRILSGRATECLGIVLKSPQWRQAESKLPPEDEAALRKLLAGSPEVLALLDPSHVSAKAVDTAEEGKAGATKADADVALDVPTLLRNGRDTMASMGWVFPQDPVGTKLDTATSGFQSFCDGISKLVACTYTGADTSVLEEFSADWENLIQFLVSMHGMAARKSYQARVEFVIAKLKELSPSFSDAFARRGG
eukprot:2412402-Amphidinium_carterae.1